MNRKELQRWLDQFPEDTDIHVVKHTRGCGYYDQGGNAAQVEFNPKPVKAGSQIWCEHDIMEFSEWKGERTLLLGGINV